MFPQMSQAKLNDRGYKTPCVAIFSSSAVISKQYTEATRTAATTLLKSLNNLWLNKVIYLETKTNIVSITINIICAVLNKQAARNEIK